MLLNYAPAVLLALGFLVAPGVIWAWRCYPSPSGVMRLTVGLALGVVYQIHVSALLALGPGITTMSVLVETLAGLALAALLAWRWPRRRAPNPPVWRKRGLAQAAQLGGVLIVMSAIWSLPLAFHQLPQGWDPSFHTLLASNTVATGRLPSWRPFEPIPSNYPYGPHVLLAQISLLTGVATYQAFSPLLQMALPLLTGLALYVFARRALRRHLAALGAVVAYGFLGNWGAVDYGVWGGLPNALGFFLLLTFLAVLFTPGFQWVRVAVGGVLLGAIPLAHHHVMLTTLLLLAAYVAYLLARLVFARLASVRSSWLGRLQPEDRLAHMSGWLARVGQASWEALRRLALVGAIALATVAYYVIPVGLRAGSLGQTDVLTYPDHFTGDIFSKNGDALWLLAAFGFALVCLAWQSAMFRLFPFPSPGRGQGIGSAPLVRFGGQAPQWVLGVRRLFGWGNLTRDFTVLANLTLLPTFYLTYFWYRAYSLARYHHPAALFTPTRFLTDMTYFLAVYAGVGLAALWLAARGVSVQCARLIHRFVARSEQGQAANWRLSQPLTFTLRGALLAFCCATLLGTLTAGQIPSAAGRDRPTDSTSGVPVPGVLAAYAWVREHTPGNTLVINLGPDSQWAAYFTRREVYLSPIPTSEFIAGYITEKRLIVGALLYASRHVPPDRLLVSLNMGSALDALLGRPVAVILQYSLPGVAARYLSFHSGEDSVYLLPSLYALTPFGPAPAALASLQWNADHTQFHLTVPAIAHAWLVCQAQVGVGVTLTLDGRPTSAICNGLATGVPALGATGSHVIVGQLSQSVWQGGASGWFDLMIFRSS